MFSRVKYLSTVVARGRTACSEQANPLFSFTSGRWLCNNDAQLKARYAPFNVDALQHVASKAMGSQVQSIKKIAEFTNRALLVTFQDGQQAIARIPTSLSGPPHFSTASEVATMDFLRRLGFPVPKVFAWSSQAHSTEVESEFIIMEKPEGESLAKIWDNVDRVDLAHKLAQLHRLLVDLRFNCYGSLYYKDDIDSPHESMEFRQQVPAEVDLSPFCIGPISKWFFWEDESEPITEGNGPYVSALDYMSDVALRAQYWIDRYAKASMHDHFLCTMPFQGNQDDHIATLENYKSLLPHIIPKENQYLHGHLWHPELNASNLFVVPSGVVTQDGKIQVNITSCIDWQGAWIGPAFLQLTIPALFASSVPEALTLPPDFETFDITTGKEAQRYHDEAVLSKLFETLALPRDVVQLPGLTELRALHALSQFTWNMGLLPFRENLINIWKQWTDIVPGHECPINFTPVEYSEHSKAYCSWLEHLQHADALQNEFSTDIFGYVAGEDPARFDTIQVELEKRRKEWVASGQDLEAQEIRNMLWPYRDTHSDNPRSHIMVDPEVLYADGVLLQEETAEDQPKNKTTETEGMNS